MSQKQRIHVTYTGTVQGVGFRYEACRIALYLGLTGFVKNLSNGKQWTILLIVTIYF